MMRQAASFHRIHMKRVPTKRIAMKGRGLAGFTLLELIVAISIFAILAAMAYSGLNNVLTTRQRTEQAADRLIALQRAFTFMARDIQQIINRPVVDELGTQIAAVIGHSLGEHLIELTRTGWRNPAAAPRSNLQRVAWGLENERLVRIYWTALDRAQDTPVVKQVMLDGVTEMSLRYLDAKDEWHDAWPSEIPSTGTAASVGNSQPPPKAVEVNLEHKVFGKIQRIFAVPTTDAPSMSAAGP